MSAEPLQGIPSARHREQLADRERAERQAEAIERYWRRAGYPAIQVWVVDEPIGDGVVLEDKGALVALVRPEPAKLRERGVTNLRDGIRIILAERAREVPALPRPAARSG
jgi:hypothetical protein